MNLRIEKVLAYAIGAWVLTAMIAQTVVAAEVAEKASTAKPASASSSQRLHSSGETLKPSVQSMSVEERWEKVQTTIRPDLVVAMCDAFKRDFPNSWYDRAEAILRTGAQKALAAIRAAQLSLDAIEDQTGDSTYRVSLTYAMRGDGDSAHEIATMYRLGSNGLARDVRRHEQWLYVAAELGRGDAGWQLAEIYNRRGLVAEAAKLEALARATGYRAPARLPSKSQNF